MTGKEPQQEKTPTLLLVDGSGYMFRAFHALPALTNANGEPTGAVYGITNMLRRIMAEQQPDYLAVIFDAPGKNFRDRMYPQYKATRAPMPAELRGQIESIHAVVQALGIPLLQVPDVEADDVIGTLAKTASEQGLHVLMSTNDKDMAQLVGPRVSLINSLSDGLLDADGVEAKFGVRPERIVDYLALIGDTVDNVPGVPKVGPKTAAKWLQAYGDLDSIMRRADEFRGKVGENLRASLEHLPLSRALVTIRCDVELGQQPQELKLGPIQVEALRDLYSRLGFNTWLRELDNPRALETAPEAATETPKSDYQIVLDASALEHWLEQLQAAPVFAFDTETTSLDYMQAEIVGVSFALESGRAAYVPVAHEDPDTPEQLDRALVLARLKPLLEDPRRAKIGQNLKYDMSVLARYGINLAGVRYDSMLESYVLNSTGGRHDIDSLAQRYLGYTTIHYEDVAGKGKNQLRFDQVPVATAGPYAAEDADITLRLHECLWPQLQAIPSLEKLYSEIEIPLLPVLSYMERTGVKVDAQLLKDQGRELGQRLAELEHQAQSLVGHSFNLGSPKQLQQILYEEMAIEPIAKTPTGQPSTAESVLQELAENHELPRLILEHRGLAKLRSTYTGALPECINPDTGRVHTSYHQAVASTGRLSSSTPNLQNIPVRNDEGRRIRQAFVAEPGYRLLAADYSQIELRIMAHLSADPGLLAAFAAGEDVHRATAAEVFGVTRDAVSPDQRRHAKAINFGLIYGMSAFGLARQLGIQRNEAQEYVDLYFSRYPGVKAYMDQTRHSAREAGFVETLFGRRLYVPEINSRNAQRRQAAERTAINAPMQGTAADIIKRAMLSVYDWIQGSSLEVRMIMQVHDELVFEIREHQLDEARREVRERMTAAANLKVELLVDLGTGHNWDEAH